MQPYLSLHWQGDQCHTLAGGPGPGIALPLGRFTPGMQVRLKVTLSTDGGQSEDATVTFTAREGELGCLL